MTRETQSVSQQRAHFGAFRAELPPHEPGWLCALRDEAIGLFTEQGFPQRKLEDWRYTNLAGFEKRQFSRGSAIAASDLQQAAAALAQGPKQRSVFVDGRRSAELSLGDEPRVASLAALRADPDPAALQAVRRHIGAAASCKEDAFVALNTAFLDDGAIVTLRTGAASEDPVHLVFAATHGNPMSHPRVLVIAQPGSRGIVVADHLSLGQDSAGFTNPVVEIFVGENASVDFVLMQREAAGSFHVSNVYAHQQRGSRLATHTVTLGGGLVRNQLVSRLCEEGAGVRMHGLFITAGSQHVDNQTLVEHAAPHCSSRELYKGVLGGRSRGVFRGRVIVRPGAQKTDAEQSSRNLLVTDRAEIDAKPQLEIYADDVKCSHGTSIGQLDAEALFYLRARGVALPRARAMLTEGFVREILTALPHPGLEAFATARVDEILRGTPAGMDALLEGVE